MVDYAELVASLERTQEPLGLLTMQAVDTVGRLLQALPGRVKALYSAEHGFFGAAAAGEKTSNGWHPFWKLPIHSLYGDHRKPTPEMLAGIGRMVIDLCDIGVRCYTYLATLKNTLEACSENGIPVTVLDRPIPLGGVTDGPMLEEAFTSFVAPVKVPLCHGMTPGECAFWIRRTAGLDLDLTVIPMKGWNHACREPWPDFIPPSPAIRSWDSAVLYPLTVFTEAYPAVDCDRDGSLAFRVIGAPWLEAKELIAELETELADFGLSVRPYYYTPKGGRYAGRLLEGILFSVSDPERYQPVSASLLVFGWLHRCHEQFVVQDGRPEWFDKLYGSSIVRQAVVSGRGAELPQEWVDSRREYLATQVDLYKG